MKPVATVVRAQVRLFRALDEPCGLALYDPESGETGFRFRDDFEKWAGGEAEVLTAIAADLPTKRAEMGAQAFFAWVDDTLSGTFRVDTPETAIYSQFERTLDNLFERKVQGKRIGVMLPLHHRRVAAGPFRYEEDDHEEGQVEAPPEVKGGPGWFAVRVAGKSMEPDIPDGSVAIFRPYQGGTRDQQIVLIQRDGEDGLASWTLKRYTSKKRQLSDSEWRHEEITMHSRNEEFDDWGLDPNENNRTLGVFVQVVTD